MIWNPKTIRFSTENINYKQLKNLLKKEVNKSVICKIIRIHTVRNTIPDP